MPHENHDPKKGGATTWFLKKLITTPATYLGLAAAFAVGNASLGANIPMGGAICGGVMAGFMVGMVTFAIMHGVKASHRRALESESTGEADSREPATIESLRNSGQSDDADLLEKIFADRDAIRKRCERNTGNADAAHTLELASAIAAESRLQAEELQDLVRRVNDPLLDSPDEAETKIEGIRGELRQAYQAVADARSRLRRGEQLEETDFLADAESLASRNLSSLARQLEEETAISRRIEERLKPEWENRIVMEDPPDSADEESRETE